MDENRISAAVELFNVKGVPNVNLSDLEGAPYLVPLGQDASLLVRIRKPHADWKSTVNY